MENVSAASRLQPRLMSAVLLAVKKCKEKNIQFRLVVEKGVDYRAKIVQVIKGKPQESKIINEIMSECAEVKKAHGISFDGEFMRAETVVLEKSEKEFERINLSEETESVDEVSENTEEEKPRKKKSSK